MRDLLGRRSRFPSRGTSRYGGTIEFRLPNNETPCCRKGYREPVSPPAQWGDVTAEIVTSERSVTLLKRKRSQPTHTILRVSRTYNLNMTGSSERAVVEDPIPGPETIGPSLDGPDWGVYQNEAESNQSVPFPN